MPALNPVISRLNPQNVYIFGRHLFGGADIFVTGIHLLDAHRPNHFQISHAHQDFFHAVHLQGAHAAVDS